jgi:hypothetical protein
MFFKKKILSKHAVKWIGVFFNKCYIWKGSFLNGVSGSNTLLVKWM